MTATGTLAKWIEAMVLRLGTSGEPDAAAPSQPFTQSYAEWCAASAHAGDIRKDEIARIDARRRALHGIAPEMAHQPAIGLALSGGGIRSATFSLGLLREFARLKLLHRFDYLSTVSGGSYIGGYYCGLFANRGGKPAIDAGDFPDPFEVVPPGQPQKLGAPSLDWLRQSGRYLAPGGGDDYWSALGLLVRNWIGVHIVIGSVLMTLALFAVGFRVMIYALVLDRLKVAPGALLSFAPLLVLLVGPVAIHVWCSWAYWLTRRGNAAQRFSAAGVGSVVIAVAALAGGLWPLVRGIWGASAPFHWHAPNQGLLPLIAGRWPFFLIGVSALGGLVALRVARLIVQQQNERRISGGDGPRMVYDPHDEIAWDECRNALTRPLRWAAATFVFILAAAIIDGCGYGIVNSTIPQWQMLAASPIMAAIIVPAARKWVPQLVQAAISKPAKSGDAAGSSWISAALAIRLGALLGAGLLIVAVVLFWIGLAYAAVWPQELPAAGPQAQAAQPLPPKSAAIRPAGGTTLAPPQTKPAKPATAPCAPARAMGWEKSRCDLKGKPRAFWTVAATVYLRWLVGLLFLSGCIAFTPTFINLSSLTSLYAARLRRAYLGAGNFNRIGQSEKAFHNRAVDVWDRGDDVAVLDYFKKDGRAAPLHLINITLNETRGAGSNIVEQDRHGRNFVVSPSCIYWNDATNRGIGSVKYEDKNHEQLPLSTWIAISGAAVSTGMGSRTGFPLTQLAGLANLRLGYWWRSRDKAGTVLSERWRKYREARRIGLQRNIFQRHSTQYNLWREFTGDFPGTSEDFWYLSDGGHFENTGAYELIRRRLPFIVVSDNGQDSRFEYEDLANLVRKARIDFACEINFFSAEELDQRLGYDPGLRAAFGTLAQISGEAPAAPGAVAALARLDYGEEDAANDPGRCSGTLLLIKPRLTGDGPADLIRYKEANQAFPQQTTADQFFDEAQWESYYHLGRLICRAIFSDNGQDASVDHWHPSELRSFY